MESCGCIKGIPGYDFYVRVIDTQTIVYTDISEWVTDEPYVIPDTYVVSVTLPDNCEIKIQVNTLSSTVIRASDIGINKFKDGIYCFHIEWDDEASGGCGLDYTKIAGIFPNLECCVEIAYSTLDDQYFEDIKFVEMWLNNAKRSSELKKEYQSEDEWRTAKRLLSKLNCECSC